MADRERLQEFLKGTEGIMFPGHTVRRLQGPVVYLWQRGGEILYVGMSRNGAARPFTQRHKQLDVQPADQLIVWPVSSLAVAREVERILLRSLKPKHNGRRALGTILAPAMGVSVRHANTLLRAFRAGGNGRA